MTNTDHRTSELRNTSNTGRTDLIITVETNSNPRFHTAWRLQSTVSAQTSDFWVCLQKQKTEWSKISSETPTECSTNNKVFETSFIWVYERLQEILLTIFKIYIIDTDFANWWCCLRVSAVVANEEVKLFKEVLLQSSFLPFTCGLVWNMLLYRQDPCKSKETKLESHFYWVNNCDLKSISV